MRPCSKEMLEASDDPKFVSAYENVMREFCKQQEAEEVKKQAAAKEGRTVTSRHQDGTITYIYPEW